MGTEEEEELGRARPPPPQAAAAQQHMYTQGQLRAVIHSAARARQQTLRTLEELRRIQQEEMRQAQAGGAAAYQYNDVLAAAHRERMARSIAAAQASALASANILSEVIDADMDDL